MKRSGRLFERRGRDKDVRSTQIQGLVEQGLLFTTPKINCLRQFSYFLSPVDNINKTAECPLLKLPWLVSKTKKEK